MNEAIALTVAWGIGGLALLIVLALVAFPWVTEDKPYKDEDGALIPCGCGCGDTP